MTHPLQLVSRYNLFGPARYCKDYKLYARYTYTIQIHINNVYKLILYYTRYNSKAV